MFSLPFLRTLYALYKILLFSVTFIVFLHLNPDKTYYYDIVVFFLYFLDATLFFNIKNRYFTAFSLAVDILFAYFIAKLLSIEEMVVFSVVPLFFSCLFIECFLSVVLFVISFLIVFFYSGLNVIFAVISYAAAFFSSYLVKRSVLNKETAKKREEFEKEFEDKISIAKRLSLEFAHEIRNPLMGISGALEIVQNSRDEKIKKEMMEIAKREIERADKLTRDFLNLEKPYEPKKISMELCAFLKTFSKKYRGNIEINVECQKELIRINSDEDMLTRMLGNLVRNAIEAYATIVDIKVSSESDKIVLIVEDNGTGIEVEDNEKEKIFLPFFTTKPQGSGLGLSICRQIAASCGGSIEICGNSAFRIELKKE